jgi:hypothetical protein
LPAQVEPIELDPVHLQPLGQQRQQPDPNGGVVERQERLLAKPRRIPETRRPQFQGDPGEYRELEIAFQFQVAARGFLDRGGNSALVIVRVDQQPHGEQPGNDEADDSTHQTRQNLDCPHVRAP